MEISPRQMQQGRFWKKYLRLTRAGVTTLRALEIIVEEERESDMKSLVAHLHDRLEAGVKMSEAMAERDDSFSLSCRELVRTAEKEGNWDLVIEEMADGLLEGTFD